MVLAALSAAAQGKYRVRVKSDYFEPVNVWTCAGLPPGSRKTAVQGAATAPLSAWEKVQRDIAEPAIKQAQSDHATLSERIGQLGPNELDLLPIVLNLLCLVRTLRHGHRRVRPQLLGDLLQPAALTDVGQLQHIAVVLQVDRL